MFGRVLAIVTSAVFLAPLQFSSLGAQTTLSTDSAAVNFQTLYHFGRRASYVYHSTKAISARHPGGQYRLTTISTPGNTNVKYFIEQNERRRTQTIVVRGTVGNIDKALNFQAQGQFDKKAGILLHKGYRTAARTLYADLRPRLKSGYTKLLTGHSLGGAVAMILAIYLHRDGYKIGGVYTFGQPKVTDVAGAKAYTHLPVTRIVHQNDIATMGPDKTKGKGIPYAHIGREVTVLYGPYYAYLPKAQAHRSSIYAFRKRKFLASAPDHKMKWYLAALKSKLKGAKQVRFADREKYVLRRRPNSGWQFQEMKKKTNLTPKN